MTAPLVPNKPILRELVKRLRSGKYKQGFSYLRKGNCYCIAGVICDMGTKGKWIERKKDWLNEFIKGFKPIYIYYSALPGGGKSTNTLPESIRKYIGISITVLDELMERNDEKESFLSLALFIEKLYKL